MSSSRTVCLNQLPPEVLHVIFYYLDVPDILRIRRVSRYLNEASRYRSVWDHAYRGAEFVRPPGPFCSQSTHDLENVLTTSFRIARNIRYGHCSGSTQRSILEPRKIRSTGIDPGLGLLFGRFLLTADKHKIQCYDLNCNNSRGTIIYRSERGIIRSFHCVSVIDGTGRSFACMVLTEVLRTTGQISIYSLNAGEQSKVTLDLLHQYQQDTPCVYSVHLGPRVIAVQGRVGNSSDVLAMDVHTRTLFPLPSFKQARMKAVAITEPHISNESLSTTPISISTSTHLVLAWSYNPGGHGRWWTFFQVFAIPLTDTPHHFVSTSSPLSPSHNGIIFDIVVNGTVLLHDSISDPSTQDVSIAIRVFAFEPSSPLNFSLKHGVLRLSATPASHDHKIGTVTFESLGSLGPIAATPFLHPSFNGIGRAFFTSVKDSYGVISVLEYDLHPGGDDEGKQAAKIVEYPSVLRLPSPRWMLDYDPYAGLICLQRPAKPYEVEIFDLSV